MYKSIFVNHRVFLTGLADQVVHLFICRYSSFTQVLQHIWFAENDRDAWGEATDLASPSLVEDQ